MLAERIISNLARFKYHWPKYPDSNQRLEPVPYLRLPFSENDLSREVIRPNQLGITRKIDYSISEGWFYTKKTREVSGFRHAAVDYHLPYGFSVSAPCDGYAVSSYYSFLVKDRDGLVKTYRGMPLRFGIGYFVQIYAPPIDRFVQLGHLSNIADNIPFSTPKKVEDKWVPTNHTLSKEEMTSRTNPNVVEVKAGELVGFVGYSGLTWEEDYVEGSERPMVIDSTMVGTWSVPHIHMDEFQRNYETGKKDWRRDPYDAYLEANFYPTHINNLPVGEHTLFLLDEHELPFHADRG